MKLDYLSDDICPIVINMQSPTYQEACALLKEQFSKLQLLANDISIKQKHIQILTQTLYSQEHELLMLREQAEGQDQQRLNLCTEIQLARQRLKGQQELRLSFLNLKNEHQSLLLKKQQITNEFESSSQVILQSQRNLQELKDKLKEVQQSLKQAKCQSTKLKGQIKIMQQEKVGMSERQQSLQGSLALQQKKSRRMQDKNKQISQQLAKYKREAEDLKEKLKKKDNQIKALSRDTDKAKIGELSASLHSTQKQLMQAKSLALDFQVKIKQQDIRIDNDVKLFLSSISEKRYDPEGFKTSLRQPFSLVIREFDKLRHELDRAALQRQQTQRSLKAQRQRREEVQEQVQVREGEWRVMLKRKEEEFQQQKWSYEQLLHQLQQKLNKQSSSTLQQNNFRAGQIQRLNLSLQASHSRIHQLQLDKLALDSKLASLTGQLREQRTLQSVNRSKELDIKALQFIVAELVRIFFVFYWRQQRLIESLCFLKQFVYYYCRVSKQIAFITRKAKPTNRFKSAVRVVLVINYLRKVHLGKANHKEAQEIHKKIKIGLSQLSDSRMRKTFLQVLTSNQFKSAQLSQRMVKVLQERQLSVQNQNELVRDLLRAYAQNFTGKSNFKIIFYDLNNKISKDLNLLTSLSKSYETAGRRALEQSYRSQNFMDSSDRKVPGKIYGWQKRPLQPKL